MLRSVELRKSSSLTISDLRLPFSYIQKQFGYPVESIVKQIHCEPVTHLGIYPDTFPNTIKEHYWISSSNGQWMTLGILQNGLYFYYTASSLPSGTFKNGGGNMNLWLATQYSSIIHYAMDQIAYSLYYSETAPF